ncbi:MAG: hypothetical protein ACXAE3_09590 [Candidatus Kariarchaeaceae archaeon]|jgi:glyceraldehyde-3-phosphate dehydrogenase (NAD(P))
MASVLINGTGTIGEPLIALLLSVKKSIGIDDLYFYKHTARLTDRPMLMNLQRKGGIMCVADDKVEEFRAIGIEPDLKFSEALQKAEVVVDATKEGVGHRNKEEFYQKVEDTTLGFLAQGSEAGFGTIYAAGINDDIFTGGNLPKYSQIASCNTHAAAASIKHFAFDAEGKSNLDHADLTFIRRASDVSQERGVMAPTISEYTDDRFGTHHAKDVWKLFNTQGLDLDIFSSAIKVNSQYMHTLSAHLTLKEPTTRENILDIIHQEGALAYTNKTAVNLVFSFGRDHGHFGRILNQAVFVEPTIRVNGRHLYFWSFTPQDGNALLSSVKAILYYLNQDDMSVVDGLMANVNPWLFNEV